MKLLVHAGGSGHRCFELCFVSMTILSLGGIGWMMGCVNWCADEREIRGEDDASEEKVRGRTLAVSMLV